ncbi:hypothetical protein [Azospirillum soli]|uniref:hypothetical protein n=1 Tax=Azospirillum soli TaxID=1304799 RepID=UPI001AE58AD2|nr:hypothetical protein [Azospirillum soli]MBP2312557.1 hypothetical protein [Azospirillum soli]
MKARISLGCVLSAMVTTAGVMAVIPASAADVRLQAAIGNETLQLVEDGPKLNRVIVNERVVFEDRDSRSIAFVNAYNLQGRWLVLLQHNGDGGNCAARYRVLDLSGPQPSVSLPFGTCSDAPEVATAGQALTVSMPANDGKSTAAWSYQAGRLARVR